MNKFRSEVSVQLLAVNFKMLLILLTIIALSIMTVWDYRSLTIQAPHLAVGYAQSIAAAIAVTATVTWLCKQM